MLFIGYSSKDRYMIVEPLLFHLKHMGFQVWYDFHDMFLGDNREKVNFEYGIGTASYIIFVISPHLFESECAQEELAYTKDLVESQKAVLFPLFFQYDPHDLPEKFCWIRNIIYNEVQIDSGTRYVAFQITERILQDELLIKPGEALQLLAKKFSQSSYVMKLLSLWHSVDERNYAVRIGLLYSLICYIKPKVSRYKETVEYIFSLLQMNEPANHLLYSVFEKSTIMLLLDQDQSGEEL